MNTKTVAITFAMLMITVMFTSIDFNRNPNDGNSDVSHKMGSRYASPDAVDLGTAANFVILSKAGISTTGATHVTGDMGVSPIAATAITGFGLVMDGSNQFSTSSLVTGHIFAANYAPGTPATMTTAISDMEAAYTDAAGRTLPNATELGAGDITSMTLQPGLYKWSTDLLVSAAGVTLNGSASDIIIFQIAQDLTVANGATITLTGGLLPAHIFWQVAGQTSIGTTAAMKGIILCQTQIVMNTGATLQGRALAQTIVTMNANVVGTPTSVLPTVQVGYLNDGYLQSAINNTTGYGIIYVANGTHNIVNQNGDNNIYINKNVTLIGNGSAVLNLTGFHVYFGNTTTVQNLNFTHGIYVVNNSKTLSVANCNFLGNIENNVISLNNMATLIMADSTMTVPTFGTGIEGLAENQNYIEINHCQFLGNGSNLISMLGYANINVNDTSFVGVSDTLAIFTAMGESNIVVSNSDLATMNIEMDSTLNTLMVTESSVMDITVNGCDVTVTNSSIDPINIDSGILVLDGDSFIAPTGEQCVYIGDGVTAVSIANCTFTTVNASAGIISESSCDHYISNSVFNVATNATAILFNEASPSLYVHNITWNISSNVSGQVMLVGDGYEVDYYGDSASDFAHCIVSNADSSIYFFNDYTVKVEDGVLVSLKSSPSVEIANDTCDEFGLAHFTGIEYGEVTNMGYANISYIYALEVPVNWSMGTLLVRNTQNNVNQTVFTSDRNITWTGLASNHVISYGVNTGGLTYRYENDNSSVSDNAIPGTPVVNENRIIIENKNTYRFYHDFAFGLFNFTGNLSIIDTQNFSLVVWKFGEVYKMLNTTNGTVFFNGSLAFGEEFWLQFQFSLKNYTITGVYSGRWAFGGRNDTQSNQAGTMGLTVRGVAAFTALGTGGTTDKVMFVAGKNAGIDHNYFTQNQLAVKNTGNTIITGISLKFGAFYNGTGDLWNASGNVTVRMTGDPLTWLAIPTDGYLNYTFTGSGARAQITMLTSKIFEFQMVNTNYLANGEYNCPITVKIKSLNDADYGVATQTNKLNIILGASTVSIAVSYNAGTTSPTAVGSDNDALGLQWGTLDNGASNVPSSDFFVIKNTGNLVINTLIFRFDDLNNTDFPLIYQVEIGGNAKLTVYSGGTGTDQSITRTTPGILGKGLCSVTFTPAIAVGGRVDLKVKLNTIVNGIGGGDLVAGNYAGGFAVTAVHTPTFGSRSIEDPYNFTAYGVMGTLGQTSDVDSYLSDNGMSIQFNSPLTVGKTAEQQIVILNSGTLPVNAIKFQLGGGVVPAIYTIEDSNHVNWDLTSDVTIPANLQQSNTAIYTLKVRVIAPSYNETDAYDLQNLTIVGIRYLEITQNSKIAEYNILVNPTEGSFLAHAGLNWFCVQSNDSNFKRASDFIALTGVSYVAAWNATSGSFMTYWFDGRGTNFDLHYGDGVVILCSRSVTIPIFGAAPSPTNYVVPEGLHLVGNPSRTPIFVSDFLASAGHVQFVAQYVDGAFHYFYPSDTAHSVNFQITGNEAVWVSVAAGETDTIIY